MPRSTRAPPDEQLSIPLQVADVVLGEQRVEPPQEEVEDLGPDQVEDLLAAPRQRHPPAAGEDPVRVGAEQVRVGVDHLRFHPEPELHPERLHPVDQRREAMRPDRRVHPPVAQAGRVVTPVQEPAVVEDEPLDADLGRDLRQLGEPVQVVLEVHGLPRVEDDRPCPAGTATAGVVRTLPQPAVEGAADAVEPVGRVRRIQPRRLVLLAGPQDDLAGLEQLARAEHPRRVGLPLGERRDVAAPAQVRGPDLAPAPAETGRSGGHHERRVVPGPPVPRLAEVRAEGQGPALRMALPAPSAGEVQHLGRHRRNRQQAQQLGEAVRRVAGVPDGVPQPQQAGVVERELTAQVEPGHVVGRLQDDVAACPPDRPHGEARRPVGAVGPRSGEAGPAAPPTRPPGQQGRADGGGQRAVRDRGIERPGDPGQQVGVEVAEIGAPVQDDGQPPGRSGGAVRDLQQQADTATAEMHVRLRVRRRIRVGHPFVAPSVRPDTNCRWRMKNTTSVGNATSTDAADTRLSSVKNVPRRLLRELVIGNLSPVCMRTVAQKNSL
jgi:hypothetical protein